MNSNETEKKRKSVRVKLYATENDDFNELWQVVGTKHKFFCRHVFRGQGIWYYVCDPLGYCELDYPANDIDFVVCDDTNHKLFVSNNSTLPFPTFETIMKDKYNELIKAGSISPQDEKEWKHWMLSFKDESKYEKEIKEMYGYDENWLYARDEFVRCEPIENGEFLYLNKKYKIANMICRHTICNKEYSEIRCFDDPIQMCDFSKFPYDHGMLGINFDESNYGPVQKHRPENRLNDQSKAS